MTLAVFAGLTLMNDLAFDGPAWWLHVAVGVKGWEDRLGRALASALVFGPVVAPDVRRGRAPSASSASPVPWLTVVVVAFLSSLGLAVGVGAVLPGTAPRTGGNPFAATSGGAAQGCLTAIVSFVGPMLLTLPVVVAAVADVRSERRPVGHARGRHGLRARPARRRASCSGVPRSTGARRRCSASSPTAQI